MFLVMEKVKVIVTKTYMDSLYKLKDNSVIVAIEKKVKKLLDNPDIAQPMKFQNEGFFEIKVGGKYRVYGVRTDGTFIIFILGIAIHHKSNFQNSKEYLKLFDQLRNIKDTFNANNLS